MKTVKSKKIHILTFMGTRPEAIKVIPIIKALERRKNEFLSTVCATAQHREMLDQVLSFFNVKPDYDLNLMQRNQSLSTLTARILAGTSRIIQKVKPHLVLIQGDTTTSFTTALSAFYAQIPVGHIEAGLRTFQRYNPFPEEISRRLISHIATFHFAPMPQARANLIKENIRPSTISITGNTAIDALKIAHKIIRNKKISAFPLSETNLNSKRIILVTGHRRENFGEGLSNICKSLIEIVRNHQDVIVVYSVHLNPTARKQVHKLLDNVKGIHLTEPLPYPQFIWLIKRAYLILTDSGSIQEEAPSLGKPVIVLRKFTERTEALVRGATLLTGPDRKKIVYETGRLLNDAKAYKKMAKVRNIYGDGKASTRILDFIKSKLI